MAAFRLGRLPPWALYTGVGVAAGGGFLLWRRRQAAAKGAASAATPAAPVTSYGADQQQSSIVPYYLTANPNADGQGPQPPPAVTGASIPTGTGAVSGGGDSGAVIPPIPPLLPISPIAPAPPPPPPPPPAPPPPPPAPAPVPGANSSIPPDLLARIQAAGERIVGQLTDPKTGGTWWLGSNGGVFAEGGARFLGSAFGKAPGTAVGIVPLGTGYRIITSRGENFDYPG